MNKQQLIVLENYSTHQPVLNYFYENGYKIAEFGTGHGSFRFCEEHYENNANWAKTMGIPVTENLLNVETKCPVIFVDSGNWIERVQLVKKYLPIAEFVVLHDSDYYDKIGVTFESKYSRVFVPRRPVSKEGPPTTIFSNFFEIPEITSERKGLMLLPPNSYGLGNILRNFYVCNNIENTELIIPAKMELASNNVIYDNYDYADCYEDITNTFKKRIKDPEVIYSKFKSYFETFPKAVVLDTVVHIRWGDQFFNFKNPHVRIPLEKEPEVNEMLKKIEKQFGPFTLLEDKNGSHPIITEKEIMEFDMLVNAKRIITFRGLDGSLSTYSLMAHFIAVNERSEDHSLTTVNSSLTAGNELWIVNDLSDCVKCEEDLIFKI